MKIKVSLNEFYIVFRKLKAYFHTYDPSHFSLLYSIKSCIGLLICIILSYLFLSTSSIFFSVLTCVFIFYMNNLESKGINKIIFLLIYTFTCALLALCIPFLISLDFYIFIPCLLWIFLVSFTSAINADLHRVGIYATLLCMAMLINATLNTFNSYDIFLANLLGGSIGTFFRTFSLYTYGGFTRKSFITILDDLIYMSENLDNNKYAVWQSLLTSRINDLKKLFESQSVNIKDTSLIKHQEMAMFYLLKCEEIAITLSSLRFYFRKNINNPHIKNIQEEIVYNLKELKNIFKDDIAKLKKNNFLLLKESGSFTILCESLEVLYYKFEIFKLGGAKKIDFKPKNKPFDFSDLKNKFNISNKHFRFSIKVSLATSFAMFLAVFFKIDHGIWIAMGVFTLFKETIDSTNINNKETFIAAVIGFGIGFLIISNIANISMLYLTLFLSYFACIYFKHFPYFISTAFLMANLSILFASLKLDYERLMFFRMLDFVIAFIIVYVFSLIWPSKSKDDIEPLLKTTVTNLKNFLESIVFKKHYFEYESKIIFNIKKLKNTLYESKYKNNNKNLDIIELLIEMNNLCISLNDYIYSKETRINPKLQSDISILLTRFKMIEQASNDLPFYFYEDVSDKILSEDYKVKYLLEQIAKKQDELYTYINN